MSTMSNRVLPSPYPLHGQLPPPTRPNSLWAHKVTKNGTLPNLSLPKISTISPLPSPLLPYPERENSHSIGTSDGRIYNNISSMNRVKVDQNNCTANVPSQPQPPPSNTSITTGKIPRLDTSRPSPEEQTATRQINKPAPLPFCICQSDAAIKIPRPRNCEFFPFNSIDLSIILIVISIIAAFILYRQHNHSAVVEQYQGLPNPEISKLVGQKWKDEPEEVKNEWKLLAEVSSYM